jgi:pimeloyl-ACP methyl ester carboxylesterase
MSRRGGSRIDAFTARPFTDTWKWLEKDLALITVPGAGHFVHRDRPKLVTRKVGGWLTEKEDRAGATPPGRSMSSR